MADLTNQQITEVIKRGEIARATEPRAKSARYDRHLGRIIVDLTNGCSFAFPPHLAQGLEQATAEQLSTVEILGAGTRLHWEALDADFSVPGLLAGIFGTAAHMARLAGQARTPAKSAAARANGAKGGRPRGRVVVG
jgi:hypothetical protein